jgi:hypothetical protein
MSLYKLLQCQDCKDALDTFTEGASYSDEMIQVLEEYSVFMEMRRLKRQQLAPNPFTTPNPNHLVWPDNNTFTVTC